MIQKFNEKFNEINKKLDKNNEEINERINVIQEENRINNEEINNKLDKNNEKINTIQEETKINNEKINNKLDQNNEKINEKINIIQEETKINNEKLNEKIDQSIQETKTIQKNIEVILNKYVSKRLFMYLFGDVTVEIFKNHKYRTIKEGHNTLMKYPIIESRGIVLKEEYLTARDLLHARFRTEDGNQISPNQKIINKLKNMINS